MFGEDAESITESVEMGASSGMIFSRAFLANVKLCWDAEVAVLRNLYDPYPSATARIACWKP